jgi:hypothetical protein
MTSFQKRSRSFAVWASNSGSDFSGSLFQNCVVALHLGAHEQTLREGSNSRTRRFWRVASV